LTVPPATQLAAPAALKRQKRAYSPETETAAAVNGRAAQYRAVHDGSLLLDVTSVFFLILLSSAVFFSFSDGLAFSHDSFYLTYLIHQGALPPVILDYPEHLAKLAGRPLHAAPWYLAQLLTDGSVAGYNNFMFACLTGSSIAFYLLLRLLGTDYSAWALAAAGLKLVWTGNQEVYRNHSLSIYAAETAFWIAACLLLMLLRRSAANATWWIWPVRLGVGLLILVNMTIYESSWLVAIALPVVLLAITRIQWREPARLASVLAWYVGCAAAVGWGVLVRILFPNIRNYGFSAEEAVGALPSRLLIGLQAALVEPVVQPIVAVAGWATGDRTGKACCIPPATGGISLALGVAFLILFLAAIHRARSTPVPARHSAPPRPGMHLVFPRCGWSGYRTRPNALPAEILRFRSLVQLWPTAALVIGSIAAVLLGIVFPSLLFDPEYGTRFMHWASVGALAMWLSFAALLVRSFRPTGPVVASLGVTLLFLASVYYMRVTANIEVLNGRWFNSFFEQLVRVVPSVEEGTFIVIDGCSGTDGISDDFITLVYRGISETRRTFVLCEGPPEFVTNQSGSRVVVGTPMRMDDDAARRGHLFFPAATGDGTLRRVMLDARRVVWLHYTHNEQRLELVAARSATSQLRMGQRSRYGEQLFPNASAAEVPGVAANGSPGLRP
jgi:hypothetical protein